RRIALAALGKLDHFFGNGVGLRAVAVADAERSAHLRVGGRHRGDYFGFEGFILEEPINGHCEMLTCWAARRSIRSGAESNAPRPVLAWRGRCASGALRACESLCA